jgi:hypothetical protein
MIEPLSPDEEQWLSDTDDDFVSIPYCKCEIEYDGEELASNICKACGKEIS